MVPDLGEAQRNLKAAAVLKGEEKLGALKKLLDKARIFQRAAAADFSIDFYTVQGWNNLVPEISSGIKKLEAKA